MGTNDFWTNAFNQVHNWISTLGLVLLMTAAQFFLDNETFTWKALAITLITAALKYYATHDDHIKTVAAVQTAVETAVVQTQEVMEEKKEASL